MRPRTFALAVSLVACAATSALAACKALPRPPTPPPYDAGPEPDAAVTAADATRYAAFASDAGDERCRCAGDVPLCRASADADWDSAGQACVAEAARLDVAGFDAMLTCLEASLVTYVGCHGSLACADTTGRRACLDAFESAATGCYARLVEVARGALLACRPTVP